jgi:hypothetical protein
MSAAASHMMDAPGRLWVRADVTLAGRGIGKGPVRQRLGGRGEYRWSHTAYPRASADSTGRASGVKQPMMLLAVVPGHERESVKVPFPAERGGEVLHKALVGWYLGRFAGPLMLPNNCSLVAM